MNNELEKFIKRAKSVKLQEEERALMKTELLAFIERQGKAKQVMAVPPQSLASYYAKFLLRPIPLMVIFLLLISTGTSFAAQNALPGDILYPVKIHVDETVQSWLAVTPDAQARLQARLAATRLKEAETLAAEGKLDEDTSLMLQDNFANHSQQFKESLNTLKTNDIAAAADASSDFETSLMAHGKILNKLSQDNTKLYSALTPLVSNVQSNSSSTTKTREELELDISENSQKTVQSDVQVKMYESQNSLNEAVKLFNSSRPGLNATTTAQIQDYFNQAQAMIQNGVVQLGNGGYGTAFVNFANAERIAQQIKILLSAYKEFGRAMVAPTSTPANDEDGTGWMQIQVNDSSFIQNNATSSDGEKNYKERHNSNQQEKIRIKQDGTGLPANINGNDQPKPN